MSTLAAQMVGADLLKLRKKRGTVIWALVLVLAPLLIYFIVRVGQHSSNPLGYGPAGGLHGYSIGLRLLALLFGPLAAIMLGAEAGAGDAASGVFRDLVVTGRSRLALFGARLPAAIALGWVVVLAGYALLALGTYALSSGAPTPSGATIANGIGFALLSTGVVCAVSVGFASLTTSRPVSLTVLIGWYLVASPLLATISSLGKARDVLLSQAITQFSPVNLGDGPQRASVTMSHGLAIVVIAVWLVILLALGAWKTAKMDA